MMKKLVFLTVIGLLTVSVFGLNTTWKAFTVASTRTTLNHWMYIAMDSTDTFVVDTFYSDTITLGEYQYTTLHIALKGFTIPDSANDSVICIVQGYGSYNGQMERLLLTDTIPTTPGTLDSSLFILTPITTDSMGINKFFFRTIVKDSFIDGDGAEDTLKLEIIYQLTQTKSK